MNEEEYRNQLKDFNQQIDDLQLDYKKERIDLENQYNQASGEIKRLISINSSNHSNFQIMSKNVLNEHESLQVKISNVEPINLDKINDLRQEKINEFRKTEDELKQNAAYIEKQYQERDEELQLEYSIKMKELEEKIDDLTNRFYN